MFIWECFLHFCAFTIHSDHISFTLFNEVYVTLPELMLTDLIVTFYTTECGKSPGLIHVSTNSEKKHPILQIFSNISYYPCL